MRTRPSRSGVTVSRTQLIGLGLVIFAGTLWLHWPGVNGGFLTRMDDDEYLRQARRVNGLTSAAAQWAFTSTEPYYHPLPRLSHVLDYQVWGTNARGHHATSVVLHALNAALVFGFFWTLLGAVASLTTGERLAMALGVAIVFAIHPLQVESVAWISGRTQLLCTAFGIGCLWAYAAGASRWAVGALFIGALLSKPMAVSLPFVMLAMDYFPLRRYDRVGWGRLLREKVVLFALGAAVSVAAMITESRAGGLMAPMEALRPSERVFLAAQSLTFYPWKLVWPAWLSPHYPLGQGFSLRPPLVLASVLCVVAVTVLCVWRRQDTPALVAGWGAYVMLVLPVSGLTQTGEQAVAERYAYMAMLPLLALVAGAAVWLWRRCVTIPRIGLAPLRAGLACLLACGFCSFSLRTRTQTAVWHDDETVWRAVLVRFPNSPLANDMLSQMLLRQGRIPEGVDYAQRAVRISPRAADTHWNLGTALLHAGRLPDAIDEYNQALRIAPDFAEAHNNVAVALFQSGRIEDAVHHWTEAVRINPDYAEAQYNLGAGLEQLGRAPEAISHYERALRLNPDYVAAQQNLARLRAGR